MTEQFELYTRDHPVFHWVARIRPLGLTAYGYTRAEALERVRQMVKGWISAKVAHIERAKNEETTLTFTDSLPVMNIVFKHAEEIEELALVERLKLARETTGLHHGSRCGIYGPSKTCDCLVSASFRINEEARVVGEEEMPNDLIDKLEKAHHAFGCGVHERQSCDCPVGYTPRIEEEPACPHLQCNLRSEPKALCYCEAYGHDGPCACLGPVTETPEITGVAELNDAGLSPGLVTKLKQDHHTPGCGVYERRYCDCPVKHTPEIFAHGKGPL